jgi:type VI secretion system protein ImpA
MTESDINALLAPLAEDAPCGEDLEDTQLLASFDAYRLFGQAVPLEADTNWREIKGASLKALAQSKDIRLLAHLAASVLRTDGLPSFYACLQTAKLWVDEYWLQVYPLVDDDAILRKNALNALADRMAIVDGVRRLALVSHRQLGSVSLRDLDVATGQLEAAPGEEAKSEAQIAATFSAADSGELAQMLDGVRGALAALEAIEEKMRAEGGSQAAPTFDPLLVQLRRIQTLLADKVGSDETAQQAEEGSEATQVSGGGSALASGPIRSREDAIRSLDLVAAYFRQNEPSSPIPLFIERAKRLVSKDFFEVLADIAPDAMSQARAAGGLKDEE